jgi:hypothetical protein
LLFEELTMLTYEDCLALCGLTEDEIEAIAEHEQVPEMIVMEMAAYLIKTDTGERYIKRMILDDIEHAKATGNTEHAGKLERVLLHFIASHPKCRDRKIA